jgi:hypothetical protein
VASYLGTDARAIDRSDAPRTAPLVKETLT